jgi:hypothetical protein
MCRTEGGVLMEQGMNLSERIEKAFAWREIPPEILDPAACTGFDSDVADALWFTGRDWHSLNWKDWQEHHAGVGYLYGEVFAYYLPSLLILSLQRPEQSLLPADNLIRSLDVPPSEEYWRPTMRAQFLALGPDELDMLKEWLLAICEYVPYKRRGLAGSGPGEAFGRAFDTVDLLLREASDAG